MLRVALGVVLVCAVGAGGFYAVKLRKRQDAERLVGQAEHLLRAPLVRVPDLQNLEAARARSLLEAALAERSDPRAEGLLAFARALEEHQKGREGHARRALEEALHALPDDPDLRVVAAAIALRAKRLDEAEGHVEKALAAVRDHARARLLAADLALDRARLDAAQALLAGLIAGAPSMGALHNRMGLVHEAKGQQELALAAYERAAELDVRLPQPHINLARLAQRKGRARVAELELTRALALDESEPEAWLGRGLARMAQGDLVGGEHDLAKARELAPAEPAPLLALGDLDSHRGASSSAIGRYRAALALDPDDAVAWLKLGNALTRERDLAGARDAFERAIERASDLSAAHNGLGAVLLGLGESDAAEKAFATAALLDASDPNPLRNLALLYQRRGDRRAALEARARAEQALAARL
jgi:tetratricopeptide (TPR) repeat protein